MISKWKNMKDVKNKKTTISNPNCMKISINLGQIPK